MAIFDDTELNKLREKLDYEIWLLDFLSETKLLFQGGKDLGSINLINKKIGATIGLKVSDSIGGDAVKKMLDAISPLIFTSSFKIIDMIFEWILEENSYFKKIIADSSISLWRFSRKIEHIQMHNSILSYPPLFQAQPYIKDYFFSLYHNLLKFRNEIVHKNKFSVSNEKLVVTAEKDGRISTLELDRNELGFLVRIVVAVAYILAGDLEYTFQNERLIKYHFDQIQKLHGQSKFEQLEPLVVNVVLKVPKEEGRYIADLNFVREQLKRNHPSRDVHFNLEIHCIDNDQIVFKKSYQVDTLSADATLEILPSH